MTAPAPAQTVTIGAARTPDVRRYNLPPGLPSILVFNVLGDGRRVGEMWRYDDNGQTSWRAWRYRHNSRMEHHPTPERAAAEVGWQLQIRAIVLPSLVKHRRHDVRIVSPAGDVAALVVAAADPDRQLVCCTAVFSGDAMQQAFHEGGARAVRARVANQLGVRCIGGGARGDAGNPVVVFTMPANHPLTLYP